MLLQFGEREEGKKKRLQPLSGGQIDAPLTDTPSEIVEEDIDPAEFFDAEEFGYRRDLERFGA